MVGVSAGAIAERRVAEHFLTAGATSSDRAIPYAPERWARIRALARLRDLAVIHGTDDALWLDETSWHDRTGTRRKRALALLALGAVSAGIAGMTTLRK